MKLNMIVTIVLIFLALLSVGQALQLNTIREKISTGEIGTAAPVSTGSQASVPANLRNLPQMVGGC